MSESEKRNEPEDWADRLPELEALCQRCDGEGTIGYADGKRYRCPVCNGAGYEPTEFGRRVLDLMRHHLRPMHEDLADQ